MRPFIGLAAAHEVVVGQVGGAVGVAVRLVVLLVVGVRDRHQLVGQAEMQMPLVEVAVPAVVGVVPGQIHLAPLTVDARGVPDVAVALLAAVGYARGAEQLGVDALVAFTGALVAREPALGGAPVGRVVVPQLVERPVMQPQGHVVLRARGLGAALGHRVVDDLRDRGAHVIIDRHDGGGAQVPDAAFRIHEVKVDAVGAGRCELEREIAPGITKFVIAAPLRTRGVADAFLAPVDVPVRGHVHARLRAGGPAGLGNVEGCCRACGLIVPAYGKGDAVLLGGGGMHVGGISGAFGCGLGQRADRSGDCSDSLASVLAAFSLSVSWPSSLGSLALSACSVGVSWVLTFPSLA